MPIALKTKYFDDSNHWNSLNPHRHQQYVSLAIESDNQSGIECMNKLKIRFISCHLHAHSDVFNKCARYRIFYYPTRVYILSPIRSGMQCKRLVRQFHNNILNEFFLSRNYIHYKFNKLMSPCNLFYILFSLFVECKDIEQE